MRPKQINPNVNWRYPFCMLIIQQKHIALASGLQTQTTYGTLAGKRPSANGKDPDVLIKTDLTFTVSIYTGC